MSKMHQPRHLQREVVCCEKLLMSYDSDPDCHVRGLTEVRVGSVLREGPCGELAPIAPAYHRPRSGGGAGTLIRPTRGAARPPPPPDCHVRGLTEVRVGSVLREGPCGELASIAPAYHRPRSGGGAGTPIRPTRGAARPPPPPTAMCGA